MPSIQQEKSRTGESQPLIMLKYGAYMPYIPNVIALKLHHAAHATHAGIASGHWSLFFLLGNDTLGGEEHASD